MNEIVQSDSIAETESVQKLCQSLLNTPHYKKMGLDGIYAIVSKARVLGISPLLALEGGMYYVKGKVEMSAQMMSSRIREAKHSITMDKRSDETICILHGKRADTGDTMSASFSIKEAQAAGLMNNNVWKIYPSDMLFARALSRLGRRLFSDVLAGCYVEGEISMSNLNYSEKTNSSNYMSDNEEKIDISQEPVEVIAIGPSEEQVKTLLETLAQVPDYERQIGEFLLKKGIVSYDQMAMELFDKILNNASLKLAEKNDPK